jgi:hypothetical protein
MIWWGCRASEKSTPLKESTCAQGSKIFLQFVLYMSFGHGGWKCIYAVYMDSRDVCLLRSVVAND